MTIKRFALRSRSAILILANDNLPYLIHTELDTEENESVDYG